VNDYFRSIGPWYKIVFSTGKSPRLKARWPGGTRGVDLDADRAGVEADGGVGGAGPQGLADILGRQRVQPAGRLGMLEEGPGGLAGSIAVSVVSRNTE